MRKLFEKIVRRISQIALEEQRKSVKKLDQAQKIEREERQADHRHYLSLLRNRHLGRRCFIIGNGPSLLAEDLEKIRDEYSFAANKIYLIFNQTTWRPSYYSVEDPLVLKNEKEQIKDLDCTLKLFPEQSVQQMGRDSSALYFNFTYPELIIDPLRNPGFPGFSRDASRQVYWGSTITYTLIQLAVYMGFRELYLLGIDHSYIIPATMDGRRYVSEGEVNHFHSEYRKVGERWNSPNLEVLEHSYATARSICETMGVKIYNASRQTKLEVFERIDLDTVLAK